MQRDAVKAGEATKYEAADTTVPAHAPPVRVGSLESLPTWLNVPGLLDSSTACADDEAGSIKTGAASPCTQMCPITLSVNVLVGQSATPNAVSHFAADSDETTQSTILSDNCQQGRDQNVSSTGGSLSPLPLVSFAPRPCSTSFIDAKGANVSTTTFPFTKHGHIYRVDKLYFVVQVSGFTVVCV